MLKGFKEFVLRGNVIELAVAVAVVTGGGQAGGTFTIAEQVFDYGAFINAMIFFVLTAVVIYFAVVAPYNAFEERRRRGQAPAEAPPPPDDVVLLTEIRDLLRGQSLSR